MRLELMFSFLQNSLKELQEFKGMVGKHSCSKGNYRIFSYIFPMQENKCYVSCVPYLVTNKKTGHTSVQFLTRQLIVKSRDHQFLTDPLRSRGMAIQERFHTQWSSASGGWHICGHIKSMGEGEGEVRGRSVFPMSRRKCFSFLLCHPSSKKPVTALGLTQ